MKQNFFEVVKLIEIFLSEYWLTSNANYSFGLQWFSDVSMVIYSLIPLLSKSVKTFLRKIARKFAICHSLKWFYKVNWANFAFVLFWRNFFQFLRKNRDSKMPPFSTLWNANSLIWRNNFLRDYIIRNCYHVFTFQLQSSP